MTPRHLVIMAAGTGGHIIPGLAVAAEMRNRGWTVSWVGTPTGMENKLVPPSGIEIDIIAFSGLRGKGLMHALLGTFKLFKSFGESWSLLRRRRAVAVLGMGGYVCFPGGLMAALLRKPLLLVNADAAMLKSNQVLKPMAKTIAFGFDGAAAASTHKAIVTGNPVRAEIEAIDDPAQRYANRSGPLRILVVGGSLGAKVLNDTLPAAIALLPAQQRPVITHQTGVSAQSNVQAAYAAVGVQADVRAFISNMAQELAQCDFVICRAGAVTVSELCAAGVPALLVPLVLSTTSHQRDNAAYMAQHGAAMHWPQVELTALRLQELLGSLMRADLQNMAEKARRLARPRAAVRVADEIERMVA